MQACNHIAQLFGGHAHILGQALNVLGLGGQELVQRGIQIADSHGTVAHDAVHGGKVSLLEGLNLGQSGLALFHSTGADHLAHGLNTVGSKEHMLGAAQANALGAHIHSVLCIGGVISVGQHLQLAVFVSPCHKALQVGVLGSSHSGDLALVDVAGRAVNGDPVAALELYTVDGEGLSSFVHHNIVVVAAAGNTANAHAASHNGCVAGHAAAHGQDALRNLHAHDILGAGFQTHQHALGHAAVLNNFLGLFSGKHNLAAGRSGRCSQALAHCFGCLQGSSVELRMQQGVQLLGLYAQHGGLFVDHALVHQVDSDLQSGLCGALAVTGLQHVELTILDGKLHVLHILEVILQAGCDFHELVIHFRHLILQVADGGRRTDTSHNIFALCIDQVLAHQALFAGSGVTGKGNARAGVHAGVTECHLLHVYSGAPLVRDLVHLTVNIGAGVIPAAEHSLHSADQLLFGVLGELGALLFQIDGLELSNQLLQVIGGQLNILLYALSGLHFVDLLFKEALAQLHNNIRVHLDEAAVAVVCETGVIGFLGQALNSLIVQAQVQDGIHHAGHGLTSAGTHGNQQRVVHIAKGFAGNLFQALHVLKNVSGDLVVDLTAVGVILRAGLGGDGEALRNRHTGCGHFCQTGALAAQNVLHGGHVTIEGLGAFVKVVQVLFAH